jgi:CRP/FNR family cyclic AMP-dependent transcriptional regulator
MNDKTVQSFDLLENVIFLKKTLLFSAVKTSELRAVASIVEEITVESGNELVKESDAGDCVYIIKDGKVKITKKTGDNKLIELAVLSAGDCFGEMALFDDEARSASAYALTKCCVLRIKRDDLIDVIIEYPMIAIELLRIFVKRLRKANVRIESLSTGKHSSGDTITLRAAGR